MRGGQQIRDFILRPLPRIDDHRNRSLVRLTGRLSADLGVETAPCGSGAVLAVRPGGMVVGQMPSGHFRRSTPTSASIFCRNFCVQEPVAARSVA